MSKTIEEKIEKVVRKTVLESVQSIFNDPDAGLFLKESAKKRLAKYKTGRKNKLVSLKAVKSKYR